MLHFFGERLFGKHDRVSTDAGTISIATLMLHVWWLPIYSKGTFVLLPDGSGIRVRATARTLSLAYLSAWPVLFILIAMFWAPIFWQYGITAPSFSIIDKAIGVAITILGVASLAWLLTWRRRVGLGIATPQRAAEIRAILATAQTQSQV